jgi:predicted Zn-dependent protease
VKVSDRPNLPFEFVVINDSVPNAWALPGGKLAVNRGLLAELKSEAELAAVLSHEIVHAAARHGASSMERGILLSAGAAVISVLAADKKHADLIDFAAGGGATLLNFRFSRENELEADHYGIGYMVRAGYDPKAAVELQETFVRLSGSKSAGWLAGMFATHPPSQERVEANRGQDDEAVGLGHGAQHAGALGAGGRHGKRLAAALQAAAQVFDATGLLAHREGGAHREALGRGQRCDAHELEQASCTNW